MEHEWNALLALLPPTQPPIHWEPPPRRVPLCQSQCVCASIALLFTASVACFLTEASTLREKTVVPLRMAALSTAVAGALLLLARCLHCPRSRI